MTLSKLLGTLTRRGATRHANTRPSGTPAGRSSTTGAEALLESSSLLFVPTRDDDSALGPQREVRERIGEILPGVSFDGNGHGAFVRTGYAIEFDTGTEDYVHAVGVRVSGGTAAMPPLARVIAKTGWRLVAAKP